MRARLAAALACLALAPVAGCGSSSSSSTTATTGAKTATSSVRVITAPKYAAPPASAPVQSGSVQIAYRNVSIHPDTVKVRVGTRITWTNFDAVEHNVTSQSGPQQFVSKGLSPGASFQVTATKAGVIHYLCTIHPASMNGTIVVVR
jgi:plastocyanin